MAETFLVMPQTIWCEGTPEKFYCLNGAWHGRIEGDELLALDGGRIVNRIKNFEIVWRGKVPIGKSDYNDAIPWILEQVAAAR